MPESQSDLHWIVQLWRQLQLAIQTHNMYPTDVKVDVCSYVAQRAFL